MSAQPDSTAESPLATGATVAQHGVPATPAAPAAAISQPNTVGVEIPQGLIEPDSAPGRALGFTSDKFSGRAYREGDRLVFTNLVSLNEGQGNLSALAKRIEDNGLSILALSPNDHAKAILEHKGFVRVRNTEYEPFWEVWGKPNE